NAEITDAAGETHSAKTTIVLAEGMLRPAIRSEQWIDCASSVRPELYIETLNGQPAVAEAGVTVERLVDSEDKHLGLIEDDDGKVPYYDKNSAETLYSVRDDSS